MIDDVSDGNEMSDPIEVVIDEDVDIQTTAVETVPEKKHRKKSKKKIAA